MQHIVMLHSPTASIPKLFFAFLALCLGIEAQAKTFVPKDSYPASTALEEARSRFEIVNGHMAWLTDWLLQSPEAKKGKAIGGIPLEYVKRLHYQFNHLGRSTLVFASEGKNPGTFLTDGQVRIAKTGSTYRSDIWINEDLIVKDDGLGGPAEALDFGSIAAVIIHEYGHHLDQDGLKYSHSQLDQLGAAFRSQFQTRLKMIEFGETPPFQLPRLKRSLNFLHFSGLKDNSFHYGNNFFFVTDSEKIWDLTPLWMGSRQMGDDPLLPKGCQEFGPSAENFALRRMEAATGKVDFIFSALRLILCFLDEDLNEEKYRDFHFNFEEKSPGHYLLKDVQY